MNKRFAVVIDCQRDFMNPEGALYVPESNRCIGPINDWIKNLNIKDHTGVLFTFDTHNASSYGQSEEAKQFPPHCLEGTEGWNLAVDVTELSPLLPQFTLHKNVFNMWEEPSLKLRGAMRDFDRDYFFRYTLKNHNVHEIEICGVAADYCVKWAIEGFIKLGYRVRVAGYHLTKGIHKQIDQVLKEDLAHGQVIIG